MMINFLTVWDLVLAPTYLMLVLIIAYKAIRKARLHDPLYRFFFPGLLIKIMGSLALGLVYYYYYKGGDTINYHETACTLVDVLVDRPADFLYLYFDSPLYSEHYLLQSQYTFSYWVLDQYAWFASKCFVPIEIICFESYVASAILVGGICYSGVWMLFRIFCREFPGIERQFAWSILYIPSVVFWGSGIMKDSITLTATCFFVHGFYWFFTQKKRKVKYLVVLAVSIFLLFKIKPYILFALFPAAALWFVAIRVAKIKNGFLRFLFTPSLLAVGIVLGVFILSQLGDVLGKYSLSTVLKTASVAQRDLKQSYYEGNSFDIGDYEPTVEGVLSVAHKAIFATLFRPTFLDVRNVVMALCAIENTFILLFCIYLIIRLRVIRFFELITIHPLLMFSFIFSIFFAFSVGVSISNFGALVRLKIPCIPFFLSSLVILNHLLIRERFSKKLVLQQKEPEVAYSG